MLTFGLVSNIVSAREAYGPACDSSSAREYSSDVLVELSECQHFPSETSMNEAQSPRQHKRAKGSEDFFSTGRFKICLHESVVGPGVGPQQEAAGPRIGGRRSPAQKPCRQWPAGLQREMGPH